MKRVCVINIRALSGRLLAGQSGLWLNSLPQPPRPMKPTLPAVPASVQASLTTGALPGEHGVIGGALFRRGACDLSLEERSNTLLSKKRFWQSRHLPQRPTTAMLFWSNPLAGAADFAIGAASYGPGPSEVVDVPLGTLQALVEKVGPFKPAARTSADQLHAARWTARAAAELWRTRAIDLELVCLGGLDAEVIRNGTTAPATQRTLAELDTIAKELAAVVQAAGGEVVVLSDGGYVDVTSVSHPNIILRQAGLLVVKQSPSGEEVADLEQSAAFAMTDHQVAQVFCRSPQAVAEARKLLEADPAVSAVLDREQAFSSGAGLERAGELFVTAAPDAWFCYRWWPPVGAPSGGGAANRPPAPGYDPGVSLGETTSDFDCRLVRASRGLIPADPADWCTVGATAPLELPAEALVTNMPAALTKLMFGGG